MERRPDPKQEADKDKLAQEEKQPYQHESVVDKLGIYDNTRWLEEAADYYVQKYGMLTAPLPALQQSDKAMMISKNEMVEAIAILDLEAGEPGLYWIAQMMYTLPFPNYWMTKKVKGDRGPVINFEYRDKHRYQYPPCICYLDKLVESIRKSDYKGVEKNATGSYIYTDLKTGISKTYADEDIMEQLEQEKTRMRNQRPSLKQFWPNIIDKVERARLYGYPVEEGKVVYEATEKGPQSSYTAYKPSGTLEEQKMEEYWLNQQHKKLADKREAEEFVHYMKDWASAKQRLESEIIRKNGQSYSGSHFEKRAFRLTNKVVIQNPRQFSAYTRAMTAAGSKAQLSTTMGTAVPPSVNRPTTGTTVYMHSTRLPPTSIYRKASAKNFHDQLQNKLVAGGYRDKNRRLPDKLHDKSLESSIEIEDDKDDLDENNEKMLSQIDRQLKNSAFPAPQFIDMSGAGKAARTIRTATYTDKKDVKLVQNPEEPSVGQTVDNMIHLEEFSIAQKRLNHARSNYSLLGTTGSKTVKNEIEIDEGDKVKAIRTMSVYGNRDVKHEIQDRPFTAIMETDPLKFSRNNELREIHQIKKRFNRYEINVPLRRIESALINPEIPKPNEITSLLLPEPGKNLLSNPAFYTKPKKGKKKAGAKSGKPKKR